MQKRNWSALLSLIVLCASCGSGGSLPVKNNGINEQAFGYSSILRIPAIGPTTSHSVYELDVLNVTDKVLNFNHLDAQFIHNGQLVSNLNKNSYLNVSDCTVLNPHSSCKLIYTPPTDFFNDATAYKLTFNDSSRNYYSLSRVLETASIPAINGFYVNSSQKLNIVSSKNYMVTIPFLMAEDLQNLKLSTSSNNLVSQRLSCNSGFMAKNSSCTATLELLPGNYNTDITVSGLAQDQGLRRFRIVLDAKLGNPNLVKISNEELLIDNTESSTHQASLFVLNPGSNNIDNVVSSISNTSNAVTDIAYQCNGQNYKQLPTYLLAGDICLVTFYIDPHSNGTFENFRVAFKQVLGTDIPSTVSSVLYFVNNIE